MDALCKRFRIDNSRRQFHTALIDCELLSKVYINLIDQKEPRLNFLSDELNNSNNSKEIDYCKRVVEPTKDELEDHKIFMKKTFKKTRSHFLTRKFMIFPYFLGGVKWKFRYFQVLSWVKFSRKHQG